MTKTELKPCPFCGGSDLTFEGENDKAGIMTSLFIQCWSCMAESARFDREDDARKHWNTRAAITPIDGDSVVRSVTMEDAKKIREQLNRLVIGYETIIPYEDRRKIIDKAIAEMVNRPAPPTGDSEPLRDIVRELSAALTSFTPGGSEYLKRFDDYLFYADTERCIEVIRDQYTSGHEAKKELARKRNATGDSVTVPGEITPEIREAMAACYDADWCYGDPQGVAEQWADKSYHAALAAAERESEENTGGPVKKLELER